VSRRGTTVQAQSQKKKKAERFFPGRPDEHEIFFFKRGSSFASQCREKRKKARRTLVHCDSKQIGSSKKDQKKHEGEQKNPMKNRGQTRLLGGEETRNEKPRMQRGGGGKDQNWRQMSDRKPTRRKDAWMGDQRTTSL